MARARNDLAVGELAGRLPDEFLLV